MRILFILENYYPNIGGVETLFKSLAEKLTLEGHSITVLTNQFDPSLAKEEFINGVRIKRLALKNRYLFTFLAFREAIKEARAHDLIHTTSYNAALPAYIAARFTGTKSIITFHEVWGRLWYTLPYMSKPVLFLHQLFESFILRFNFDKFIAVSDFTKDALVKAGVDNERVTRIYNGIDYSEFENKPKQKHSDFFQFCFFGRLGISKGINLIVEACGILKEQDSNFRIILILPRQPESFLNRIINEINRLKLEHFFIIKHELSFGELTQNITASQAVLIPSYSEGFCFAAVETMALNTPIISSGRGALKEVVGGKHLTMSEHTPEGLAQVMALAMKNKWDQKEIIRFPLSESVNQYVRVYESMLSD